MILLLIGLMTCTNKRKERHELLSLIGNVSVLFDDWDDADF